MSLLSRFCGPYGFAFVLFIFFTGRAYGQAAVPADAWMQPIEALFAGMNRGDSALVRTAFTPDATLASVQTDAAGNTVVRRDNLARLLAAIGTPRKETWTEPIWNVAASPHGSLVQVVAEYAFYIDKRLSHCGTDVFQLVKDKSGRWKIFHLTDTRQREGCRIPASVADQFR